MKKVPEGEHGLLGLPKVQRLIVVACLRDGRPHAEVAALLDLPVEEVEAQLAAAQLGDVELAVPDDEIPAPDLADHALRSVRRRRLRGAVLPTAIFLAMALVLAFLQVRPLWAYLRDPAVPGYKEGDLTAIVRLDKKGKVWTSAMGEGSFKHETKPNGEITVTFTPDKPPTPQAWKVPRTGYGVRYAVPNSCMSDFSPVDMDKPPPPPTPGTVNCQGWTLTLVGGESTGKGELTTSCSGDYCEQSAVIPDAARLVTDEGSSSFVLDIAISRDGHRVAYLSSAERRYIAADLRTKKKVYLTPELTPAQMREYLRVRISPEGGLFTVEGNGKSLRTDFDSGITSPVPATDRLPEKVSDKLETDYYTWADSPDGKRSAGIDSEHSKSGTLDILDSRTGKLLNRHPLPSLGGATESEALGWVNDDEVAILMTAGTDFLGWFRVDAKTGRLVRMAGIPSNNDIVLGAAVLK
ncbi:sigma-70 region 4 domain-containing protein [Nonomuraea endophytica]|uniref:Uncharacterized protein n=1 Tax=Nonomuraea endophytica TaxID=714136 RepID=A0A7W8A4T1_9ACTN|nr:sigma-70 region 4 domain-containing protein [Nonomuraea endophytica]MBB5079530.1 hypothetical protein [Nonomuraea endophytica]